MPRIENEERTTATVDLFDRAIGNLSGLPDVVHTKPATIRVVPPFGVGTQLWVIQTYRQADLGDSVFIECLQGGETVRIVIPATVANRIAWQREQLSKKTRSKAAKRVAQERKERGELPGFMKGRTK